MVSLVYITALSAGKMLPFFEFDFNAYLDTYNQLIVNDVYSDSLEKPYYSSLETALSVFSTDFDRKALEEKVRQNDAESLKEYIRGEIENGSMMADNDIYELLFNPENMYSAYVSPTTDSAMSYFGHNFLIFYIPEAPMLSPCINFYAYYEHLSAMGTVIEGLKGSLISYYDFQPFYVSFLDYTATRDRSIAMSKIDLDVDIKRVTEVMKGLTSGTYPNYSFLYYNCSHGFMNVIERMDDHVHFPNERALSPAMGIRMFREMRLIDDPDFEFPAWNDTVDGKSSDEFVEYYEMISSGVPGFKSEPFENLPFKRDIAKRKRYVSSRFSSLSFRYGLDDELNHRLELWFKPVFNNFVEQNYVDHEIINLRVLSGGASGRITNEGRFEFEGFEAELLAFDSIFPFTKLKKRMSFGADLSFGMRNYMFLAETDFYGGMALGSSEIFWFIGLDNVASTAPLEYTLNFRNMVGGTIGNASFTNITDMVLFSTLHEYFHIENRLNMKIKLVDSLSLGLGYNLWTEGKITGPTVRQSGEVHLIWNFNIF